VIVSYKSAPQSKAAVTATPSKSGEASVRQEGPQLAEKTDVKPRAGAMFKERDVLHPKIVNVKIILPN